MRKFTEYIGSQFGNPHGFVGRICCVIMNVINKAMYKNTVALMKVNPGDKVLDIGYGNGYLLQSIYRKVQVDLYGIDISQDMMAPGASFYNVAYTKEWLDTLSYTKKGFKKFEPEQLIALGKQAGFEKIDMKDIVKGKSFVVIYTKNS